ALAHELAHLKRRDLLWSWVPILAHTCFWFFPVSWLTLREYSQAREEACDADALRVTRGQPDAYARLLLAFGTHRQRLTAIAACGASPHFHHLKRRLTALQRFSVEARDRATLAVAGMGALLLVPIQIVAREGRFPRAAIVVAAPGFEKYVRLQQDDLEVRARHIVVRVDANASAEQVEAARQKAQAIAKEAREPGVDFAALAKEKSQGASASQGGDLGYFKRGVMLAEFEKVAFKLKPGEVSDPVRTQYGWHIIKVDEIRDTNVKTYEQMKDSSVKEIKLIGAIKVPADDLKRLMFTRVGGTFREETFQHDLTILQAAYYDRGFVDVKIDNPLTSISADNRFISISIKIEEGEAYSIGKIDFSGDLLVPKEGLGKLMTSHEGELFNRSKLARDISAITGIYLDQGYAYVNLTPLAQPHREQRLVNLTFDIQKGNQVYVERIDIRGNIKTRDKEIRREMGLHEGELFSGTGERRSKERVTALGLFETVEVQHKPGSDNSKVVVTVEVKEKDAVDK
ncbi:MAG TPA: POTRA domain-containing protein, partial [Candidatus Acidoferrales bacterium]|nr:POTRA domain-containing protein [Candidatus Acidoferrales bacterium]